MAKGDEVRVRSAEKPGPVTALTVLTLVSGIINLLWSVGAAVALAGSLVGLLCVPLAAYPLVLGILEIVFAAKLLGTPTSKPRPATYLAIMEIVNILFLTVFSVVVGILALVFYNDQAVKAYFAELEAGVA
ncbi:MAG: hypothetical protein AABY97_01000 [Chloroflexota bacterium]